MTEKQKCLEKLDFDRFQNIHGFIESYIWMWFAKMLRSQNPHGHPLRHLIFDFFFIFVELLKDFYCPKLPDK